MVKFGEWKATDLVNVKPRLAVNCPCYSSKKESDFVRKSQKMGRKESYLRVSRIGIEHIREKLASASNSCNDQTMDVEAINNKEM